MPKKKWTPEDRERESARQKARIAVELQRRKKEHSSQLEVINDNVKPIPTKLNKATLTNWAKELQFGEDVTLDEKLEIAANLFVEHAVHDIAKLHPRDAMIAAGIAIEKMELLRNIPTEIIGAVPILLKIAEISALHGFSLNDALSAFYESIKKKASTIRREEREEVEILPK